MEILRFSERDDVVPASAAVTRVAAGGGVVLLPTETFYGLAVDPDNREAIARVFRLKARPEGLPLPVLCSDWQQVETLCHIPDGYRVRLSRSWPGPLTAILPARRPLAASSGATSVAVRIPGHDLLRALLYRSGPLTGTSANRSGAPPHTTAEEARSALAAPVELVLDGGRTPGGLASTLVDLTGERPQTLRPGPISWGDQDFWAAAGFEA